MNRYHSPVLCLSLATLLVACSSSPPAGQQLAREQQRIEQQRATAAQQRAEKAVDALPEWAISIPRPDSTGLYALGISESDRIPVALRKAQLQAEYGLAKQYNQELSGSERAMQQDGAGSGSAGSYQQLIQSLVNYVPVVGFEVVKQQVQAVNGQFQAYVLLKLPYAEFNKALQTQRQQTQDAQMQLAFRELERRLQQRQQQAALSAPAPLIPAPGRPAME